MSLTQLQQIWGNPDCLLTIFIGSSAEFALNPAVDWLFYTGKLPADPVARFASTVAYSHKLIFADDHAKEQQVASQIQQIHTTLETKRGYAMPPIAYRDVLMMTMEYTLRAYPLVFGRELSVIEKDSLIQTQAAMWQNMRLPDFPTDYATFQTVREEMFSRFAYSEWSPRLMAAYRRASGRVGYVLLLAAMRWIVDERIVRRLGIAGGRLDWLFRGFTIGLRRSGLNRWLLRSALPREVYTILHQYDRRT